MDGENFRHSIIDLFSDFHRADYLPKSADWTSLFDWIVGRVTGDGDRVRTYWYVIQALDFYPYRFPRVDTEPDKLRRLLARYEPFKQELDALADNARITRMREFVEELQARQARLSRRFEGWTRIQEGIASRHDAVEFRRAGAIRCDLFSESLGQEKAVDVKLAADLIVLRDIYDVAIILSGDQDYVPAVEVVKDSGKQVVNVAFRTRGGRLLPGGARRLNQVTDRSIAIDYGDLANYLGL